MSDLRMLENKVIMITGASSGIGAAAARLFAAEGAAVVVTARREGHLEALAEEIRRRGGQATAVAGDVARCADVAQVVARAVAEYGRLDGALNNAGWATAGTRIHETDGAVFDQIVDVNLRGVWNCLQHQLHAMLAAGCGGSIVNTASVAGVLATGANASYVAAKHAVIGLTKAAAQEYAPDGVRVNSLVVGSTRTELMTDILTQTPSLEECFTGRSLQKRMADPVEVAQAAAWLCSDRSSFVTGTALPVDGGWTAA
ncbi:glucose 1-dehydrogenase [Streptomyces sp. NBC_00249]|uniref:SDR family NAD(P)-dependent oxidoreductase n=1 Tax=Streptomyces sp. NBC_00249 TaxID=2975690 RepID=UPI00225335E7|nr:glucose 1-dehydrogenase [Streptomyces sp. NBC_00249]MCX5199560.1 glucose 1-dehydrogenase [Streptomyces sp. NBC_00249]